MQESFVKLTEYVNPIEIGVWVISLAGMVIRTSIFYEKTVWRLSPWRRFWLRAFIIFKLKCHTLIVKSKMKSEIIEKYPGFDYKQRELKLGNNYWNDLLKSVQIN